VGGPFISGAFWNNGMMARPGAAYLESIIIIVITQAKYKINMAT